MRSCTSCGAAGHGAHYPECQSNLNAPASPPAGDVPAARPELSPGEAASFVDWEAVACTQERHLTEMGRQEWWRELVAKHTHLAPVGLAAEAISVIESLAHVGCWAALGGRCYAGAEGASPGEQERCERAQEFRRMRATPAAVAALDRAADENKRLRDALERTLWLAERWVEGSGQSDPDHEVIAEARAALGAKS